MVVKFVTRVAFLSLVLVCLSAHKHFSFGQNTTTAWPEQQVPGHYLALNGIDWVHAHRPALNGVGTLLSIKEFGFDSLDIDLQNRISPFVNPVPAQSLHPTLMATTAAGAGNSGPAGQGVAWGATLYSSSFVGLLPDTDYETPGIEVQNHSYGSDVDLFYSSGAAAYDATVVDWPYLVHVFSAGNKGDSLSVNGQYAFINGFANITGAYKMAKNILLVGATDSTGQVLPFSSRGPAHDGRVKPDLVAFGSNGTSGAAALVSGAAAVVRQAFFNRFGFYPTAHIVQAVLLCSATDIGPAGPDFESGFGALNLKNAVELVETQVLLDGTVSNGGVSEYTLQQVPDQVRQMKVLLHWNEPPAAPLSGKALLNDLDIEVVAPNGSVFRPLVLNVAPNADALRSSAQMGTDTLNNTELIVLDTPVEGDYTIRIKGQNMATAQQTFGVAVWMDTKAHFEWVSPTRGAGWEPATTALLHWQNTYDTTGRLYWRDVRSGNWTPIADQIDLSARHYRWRVPDTLALAQMRMEIGNAVYDSDTFMLVPAPKLSVGFHCSDSVMLYWPKIAPQINYRLWGLGSQYMEPLLVLQDTAVVLSKMAYPQPRFALSYQWEGHQSLRGSAPEIGTSACYITNFYGLLDGAAATLNLSLNSLYRVATIRLERADGTNWVRIAEETTFGQLNFSWADDGIGQGENRYRVQVILNDGSLASEALASVFYTSPESSLLFPNPYRQIQGLQILTNTENYPLDLILWNVNGQQVCQTTIEEPLQTVQLPALLAGVYAWRLTDERGTTIGQGQLVLFE